MLNSLEKEAVVASYPLYQKHEEVRRGYGGQPTPLRQAMTQELFERLALAVVGLGYPGVLGLYDGSPAKRGVFAVTPTAGAGTSPCTEKQLCCAVDGNYTAGSVWDKQSRELLKWQYELPDSSSTPLTSLTQIKRIHKEVTWDWSLGPRKGIGRTATSCSAL